MLQKIEASLRQLVERPTGSPENLTWATGQVNLFFGSFRKADADDPETFTAGCLRLFTAYPADVVRYIVDPLTGLPGKTEWLPSLRKVKETLDARSAELRERDAVDARERAQIEARKQEAAARIHRPTLEELQAKHGPNWGLAPPPGNEEAARERRRELLTEVNRRAFEAECRSAGVPTDSAVSPSLAAIIRRQVA